jgi:acyl dehydratase
MPSLVVETQHDLVDWVGREIAVTDWFPVTEGRIRQFAEVTEDRQWIHVDRKRAESESPFGTTVAHGFLTLSLASHFLKQAIEIRQIRMGVNYGLNRVRFPSPVRAESQIRARVSVDSVKALGRSTEAIFSIVVECQGESKPCCVAQWIIRYY